MSRAATATTAVIATLASALTLAAVSGCQAGALVIGEAATDVDAAPVATDAGDELDAQTFVQPDGGDTCVAAGGTCLPSTASCGRPSARTCGNPNERCCLPDCPISALPPNPCDGGPVATLYSKIGCPLAFSCAPVDCVLAGGRCGATNACEPSLRADASLYQCAAPDTCCLP